MLISSELLSRYSTRLLKNPLFTRALLQHCDLMYDLYRRQPLFYKMMFRDSRFNSILSVCCFVFGNQASSLSDVKHLCARYQIASPNSIIAILTLLKTSGRLSLKRDEQDRRKTLILPTPRGLEELKETIICVFNPLQLLCPSPRLNVQLMDNDEYRHNFYYRAAQSLFRGIRFENIYPEACLFIDKDAGRFLLLRLYRLAHDDQHQRQPVIKNYLSRLSRELSVSRTHLRRMITSAIVAGYFVEETAGNLTLTPAFFQLAERYAALYFSWTLYFSNVRPQ